MVDRQVALHRKRSYFSRERNKMRPGRWRPGSFLVGVAEVCTADSDDGAEAQGEPIRMGSSLPLTEVLPIRGSKYQDGYQFCVDLVNDRGRLLSPPVEVITWRNREAESAGLCEGLAEKGCRNPQW